MSAEPALIARTIREVSTAHPSEVVEPDEFA
jgi:hypothetical protein